MWTQCSGSHPRNRTRNVSSQVRIQRGCDLCLVHTSSLLSLSGALSEGIQLLYLQQPSEGPAYGMFELCQPHIESSKAYILRVKNQWMQKNPPWGLSAASSLPFLPKFPEYITHRYRSALASNLRWDPSPCLIRSVSSSYPRCLNNFLKAKCTRIVLMLKNLQCTMQQTQKNLCIPG